jgi:transglutaminase-like putative cysteine protease
MKKLQRFYLCLITAISFSVHLFAQDKLPIKFGKVTVQDFDLTSPVIDSSTNAVVVANVGKSEFFANTTERTLSLLYKEKKRIKIINKNGYDAATITIHLYVDDNNKAETLQDLDAFTYNLEGGKVVQTKLERSSVFTEKESKNWIVKKFTFPALKEGSIVEYAYEVKSDFYFNFQPWVFQGEYPVLWSQYEASIPEFFKYVILAQGYQQFFINKTESTGTSFSFSERTAANNSTFTTGVRTEVNNFSISGLVDYHTWVMKNVPALKVEPFTSTLRNSIDKIEFQLKEIAYPNTYPRTIMNSWQKVSEDLLLNENFGAQINRANNWLDDDVKNITGGVTQPAEKVKRIYEYVRDNFVCNDSSSRYISTSLKDAFKNRAGSVADINMLLIAMLRTQDIVAYPVIVGTRDHGATNEYYPIMERYNYVIARVDADNQIFYLDAATPRLAFNKLPLKAYNGHARIMNKAAAPVFFVADSINEASNTMVFISNGDHGVEGSFVNNKGYYQALTLRNKIAKTGLEDYKKDLQKDYPEEVVVSNFAIDSLKKLDEPVAVKYDLNFKAFGDADIVYFNPMLGEALKKNPFTAAQRFYPVEMPYTVDETYTFNMEVPKGYQVDELPKSARIMLNENEGMFEYLVSGTTEAVQMRCRLQLKRATYLNEDYESLRDFFAYVVKKEAEQIVFKKIK